MSEPFRYPSLANLDTRLRLAELRVLGAICFLYQPGPDMAPFDRKHISKLIDINERVVSQAACVLESAGWVTRFGNGKARYCRVHWNNKPLNADLFDQGSEDETLINTIRVDANADQYDQGSPDQTLINTIRVDANADQYDQGCELQCGSNNSALGTNADQIDQGSDENAATDDLYNNEDINIKYISTTTNDLSIDSEQSSVIVFGQAYELLIQHGMPHHYAKSERDKDIIRNWISMGVTSEELVRACEWAKDKKKPGSAIGPRYINGCISTLRKMSNDESEQSFAGQDYAQGRW